MSNLNLNKTVSIRISKIDASGEGASKSFSEYESREADNESKKLSIFSKDSNFPNIAEMYKQQAPSRFLQEARKRIESEDVVNSLSNQNISIDGSKRDPRLSIHSKFSKSIGRSLKEKDLNDSVASKVLDFKELQKMVTNKKDDGERHHEGPARKDSKEGTPLNSKQSSLNTQDRPSGPNKIDRVALMNKIIRVIRIKVLKNIRFFNIISKTYHIDDRCLKQRYFYLYQDKSIDLEDIKKAIKDSKSKKDNDVNYILRKLGTVSDSKHKQSFFKRLCGCKRDLVATGVEPDYSYKDQIDIPMKTEPVDSFVFNPYSPYLILWNLLLALELLMQLFLKVVSR